MISISIRAPVADISGYGSFSRNFLLSLVSVGLYPDVYDLKSSVFSSYSHNSKDEEKLFKYLLSKRDNDISKSVVINITPASLFNRCYGVSIGVTMLEVSKCSDLWVERCNLMDKTLVPGSFNLKVHKDSGVNNVEILEPPLDTETFVYRPNDLYMIHRDIPEEFEFVFLTVGQIFHSIDDRKGISKLVRAFVREFRNDKSVALMVKTNVLNHHISDRIIINSRISDILQEEKSLDLLNRIIIYHRNQTKDEMATLYSNPKIRCGVFPSFGEGVGLNSLEVSACGVPIITTGWSEHINYLKQYIPLDYELREIPCEFNQVDQSVYPKDALCAYVSVEEIQKKMRNFYESEKLKEKVHLVNDYSNLSFKTIGKKILDSLKDVEIKKKVFYVPDKLQLGTGFTPQDGYFHIDIDYTRSIQIDYVMDARKLTFPNNSITNILIIELLEHFYDYEIIEILNQCMRVLKPGGEIEIHLPNVEAAFKDYLKSRGNLPSEELDSIVKTILGSNSPHVNLVGEERLKLFLKLCRFCNIKKIGKTDRVIKLRAFKS